VPSIFNGEGPAGGKNERPAEPLYHRSLYERGGEKTRTSNAYPLRKKRRGGGGALKGKECRDVTSFSLFPSYRKKKRRREAPWTFLSRFGLRTISRGKRSCRTSVFHRRVKKGRRNMNRLPECFREQGERDVGREGGKRLQLFSMRLDKRRKRGASLSIL